MVWVFWFSFPWFLSLWLFCGGWLCGFDYVIGNIVIDFPWLLLYHSVYVCFAGLRLAYHVFSFYLCITYRGILPAYVCLTMYCQYISLIMFCPFFVLIIIPGYWTYEYVSFSLFTLTLNFMNCYWRHTWCAYNVESFYFMTMSARMKNFEKKNKLKVEN